MVPVQETKWIGWRKLNVPRAKWEAISHGETEPEAFRALLIEMNKIRSGSWSTIVLPAGKRP